jgi:anti-sigma factor RsiW
MWLMTHATEGLLQAYLDDEVADAARAEIAGHLDACAACAAEAEALVAVNAQAHQALMMLDAPVSASAALVSVRQRAAAAPARRGAGGLRGSLSRAAGLVLLTVGAASAAIPGSPVRSWLAGAWDRVSSLFVGDRAVQVVETPVAPPPAEAAPEAYAAVALAEGQVRVLVSAPTGPATIRVRLVAGQRAAFQSTDTSVRFVSATGRLEITGLGAGEATIDLPRSARLATVEIAGRTVVRAEDGRLLPLVSVASATDDEVVIRVP